MLEVLEQKLQPEKQEDNLALLVKMQRQTPAVVVAEAVVVEMGAVLVVLAVLATFLLPITHKEI
jgi:hypothetical protein